MFRALIIICASGMFQTLDDWSFDVFTVNDLGDGHALKYVGYELLQRYDLINKFKVSAQGHSQRQIQGHGQCSRSLTKTKISRSLKTQVQGQCSIKVSCKDKTFKVTHIDKLMVKVTHKTTNSRSFTKTMFKGSFQGQSQRQVQGQGHSQRQCSRSQTATRSLNRTSSRSVLKVINKDKFK